MQAAARVRQRLRQPPAVLQLRISAHLEALMSEAHRATWFRHRGTGNTVVTTTRGCRPGPPWGAFLYNLLMIEVLADVTGCYMTAGMTVLYQGQALAAW